MRSRTNSSLATASSRARDDTEPNWADLGVELKKPGVTLLILWEE
ncbi:MULTISPECIES: hypothetical protein [unclassified Mesorhizobium]|nr:MULTISPECIES: hypothetical protein [unclassified Mesorhizobium]